MEIGSRVIGLYRPVKKEGVRHWETIGFGTFIGEQVPHSEAVGMVTRMRRDANETTYAFAMDDGEVVFDTELAFYPAGSEHTFGLSERLIPISIKDIRAKAVA